MSETFFISDLHFGHKKIIEFGKSTGTVHRSGDTYQENMHNIITKWNSVVTKRDKVFVHGDVAFSQEGYDALFELNGSKTLVRGNHDCKFTTEEWLKVFDSVEGIVRYKDYWLTHAPIHPLELRGKKNIHGHVHQYSIRNTYTNELDPNYLNVSCEALGETPISLTQIRNGEYDTIRRC
jgi:calcineurin-like phosphoesterase family protein